MGLSGRWLPYMKHNLLYFLLIVTIIATQSGCQDKYIMAVTLPAKGSLKADQTGNCLPKVVSGVYTINKNVSDSNFVTITANVVSTGTFLIKTDTVNGYFFKATGSFSVAGLNQVKLIAYGKPLASGNNVLKISFDTSICYVAITVQPLSVPAVYNLQGNPSSCISDTVFGVYAAGAPLDTSNRIAVLINVTSPGAYSITTNSLNGYGFSGSGLVNATGIQSVTLNANGTPASAGTNNFSVTGNATTCAIPVTVVTPVTAFNNDYFPLSNNSYWNYDDLYNLGDTLQRIMVDSTRLNGSLYKTMEERTQHYSPVSHYFRKVDSAYYEYGSVDMYTRALVFAPAVQADIPLVRENLKTGATWYSNEYIGTISSKQPIYLRYQFICNNNNASVTLNGQTFTHVYKITMLPQVRSAITYPYNITGETITTYYARGIGIIYTKFTNSGFVVMERQLRNWKVY